MKKAKLDLWLPIELCSKNMTLFEGRGQDFDWDSAMLLYDLD